MLFADLLHNVSGFLVYQNTDTKKDLLIFGLSLLQNAYPLWLLLVNQTSKLHNPVFLHIRQKPWLNNELDRASLKSCIFP